MVHSTAKSRRQHLTGEGKMTERSDFRTEEMIPQDAGMIQLVTATYDGATGK